MAGIDLSRSIYRSGLYAVGALALTGALSTVLPLEAPAPTQAAAAEWLNTIGGTYLLGWLNQIAAMLSLSMVLAAAGALIFSMAPLRAGLVWGLTLIATILFLLTKFLSLWAVPMMVKAIAAETSVSAEAGTLLTALAPHTAFGLLQATDLLGFWLFGLVGILMFRPLFRLSVAGKVAAISALLFGVGLNLLGLCAFMDVLSQGEFLDLAFLLRGSLFAMSLALAYAFWRQLQSVPAS